MRQTLRMSTPVDNNDTVSGNQKPGSNRQMTTKGFQMCLFMWKCAFRAKRIAESDQGLRFPLHYEIRPIQIYWNFYHQKKKKKKKKKWKFSDRSSDIFHISSRNIDYGYSLEPPRSGGSNEYPQSMFLSRNKKNNVYHCKLPFYYVKVGFKVVNIIQACFRDVQKIELSKYIYMYWTSRKHAYKILIPLNPTFIYKCSKTGIYRGIHCFSYFCSKHRLWVLVRNASARRF